MRHNPPSISGFALGAAPMSDFLGELLGAICGEAFGNAVERLVDHAPAWVLGLAFFAVVGLTVFLFVAVHWSLGLLGAAASVFLGFFWIIKLCFS